MVLRTSEKLTLTAVVIIAEVLTSAPLASSARAHPIAHPCLAPAECAVSICSYENICCTYSIL